ncbi:3-phosphoshikimate 1-carboxyvinyltransferase [Candidatus Margulisiibacteriota bacterium]
MSKQCLVKKQTVKDINQSITIPGDKSISHRAIIVASLAENNSIFGNFLFSEDCLNTARVFQELGVDIELNGEKKTVSIKGVGLKGLKKTGQILDVGNAGTGIRLISGVLSGQDFVSQITGDNSIQKRPMKRAIEPLTLMGAEIKGRKMEGKDDIYPPLTINGKISLNGIKYTLPVASAQVKSAILFASLYSLDRTVVTEPEKCRDHTERILKKFGADIQVINNKIYCSGLKKLKNPDPQVPLFIPSDPSSAAFFVVLACLLPGTELVIKNVGLNPTRARYLDILKSMGADLTITSVKGEDFEPYGDIIVRSSSLENISIKKEDIPFVIDEIPILAVAALSGKGTFVVRNAAELRIKESDRIEGVSDLVKSIGGNIKTYADGFEIEGSSDFKDFAVESKGDHRLAMSAIIAALAAGKEAIVKDHDCINTSFPDFFRIIELLGFVLNSVD